MREIKFRAWDKESEVMRAWEDLILEKDDRNDFWLIGYRESRNIVSYNHDQILMQYTGLKDKNGVEVYFGDALTNGDMTRTVIWREEDSQIQLSVNDDNYETRIKLTQQLINIFELTVCGNIYENPELLKESGASE